MSQSTTPPNPDDYFGYKPLWCEKTFTSRAKAEALLGPQHAEGHLTIHDYNASLEHFGHPYRFYPMICGTVGASLALLYKPRRVHRAILLLGTFGAGFLIGKSRTIAGHMNYLRSLENPEGVKTAMQNIEQQLGTSTERTITIAVPLKRSRPVNETAAPDTIILPNPEDEPRFVKPAPQTQASGKWEEIRRANSQKGANSTWDAIRQKNEKAALDPSPPSSTPESNAWGRDISEITDTDRYHRPDPPSSRIQ